MSDPNDEPRPVRVMVFPARPDVLLIYAPNAQPFWLPPITPPFDRQKVAEALRDHDVPARVAESVPGRFTHALMRAAREAKAERVQRQQAQELARRVRVQLDPTADTFVKQRAALLHKLDETLKVREQLKLEIGRAKSRAHSSGQYLAPSEFRNLEARFAQSREDVVILQRSLAEVRAAERAANGAKTKTREEHFIRLVREVLTKEEWDELWADVDADLGEETRDRCSREAEPSASPDHNNPGKAPI